jgi:hypothetical protein
MNRRNIPLAILSTLAFTSQIPAQTSSPKPNPPSPPPQAVTRVDLSKRASEIDPRCREYVDIDFLFNDPKTNKPRDLQHAAVDPTIPQQGKLVIWLMDHNAPLFERTASYGLHAIQVSYANRWFGKLTKEQLNDGNSLGKIRLEAATGEDHSPIVSISEPDSIAGRAYQFVKWLSKEHPAGHWDQFIQPDTKSLRWDKVILSGISHGSTTAARLAIHQKVDRVVMFSGPRDNTESWQSLPSATPPNRFFGFTHVLDGGWTADHYCRSWQLLKLQNFGPLVNVETATEPFGHSRRLITDFDVKNDSKRAHTAVVPGGSAGKDGSGKLIHEKVWRYLFNHPVEQTGSAVEADAKCNMQPH